MHRNGIGIGTSFANLGRSQSNGGSASVLAGFFTSFWKLADTADAIGSNTLTNGGLVTFGAGGKIGSCGTGVNNAASKLTATIIYPTGGKDFTVAAWFKSSSAANQYLFNVALNAGMALTVNGATSANFLTDVGHIATKAGSLVDGNWHLLVGWYDAAATTNNLNVDHGTTVTTTAGATAPLTGARATSLFLDTGASFAVIGSLDAMGFGPTKPTQAILDALWNAGAGVEPPF